MHIRGSNESHLFFELLFTDHLRYRKDHWKAAVHRLKDELAKFKNAAKTQIAATGDDAGDEASEAMDGLLRYYSTILCMKN